MAKKKRKKISKQRRPRNINIGMIIFICIFIYMAFSVYAYVTKEKIQFYEVTEGNIVKNKNYTGFILREESVEQAERTGYVNAYVREGKRAAVGTCVYSLDETGTLVSLLNENQDNSVPFKQEQLQQVRRQLSSFTLHYRDRSFYSVYDMKAALESSVLEQANDHVLEYIDSVASQSGISFIQVRATQAGVISYVIDGYEERNIQDISATDFDRSQYQRTSLKPGSLIEKDAAVYKCITSDHWSLVFPLSEDEASDYESEEQLTIKIFGKDITLTGGYSTITGKDGNQYGRLQFDQYLLQFLGDRYIDFEVVSEKSYGLKIPITAVTTKNFYLVPLEYLAQGGNSMESGFYKEVYAESGTSIVFTPTTLYYSNDENYYIDSAEGAELKAGDYIVKPDSNERYQLGSTASLEGVYNINKGYTVFKQIDVLEKNDEYYTVRRNMKYGLSVYDHIVLDVSLIEKEGAFIYQ